MVVDLYDETTCQKKKTPPSKLAKEQATGEGKLRVYHHRIVSQHLGTPLLPHGE